MTEKIKREWLSRKMYIRSRRKGYCPKCGNVLILKSSKYGAFQGCFAFPRCRYAKWR